METPRSGKRGVLSLLRRLGTLIVRIPGWLLIGMVMIYRWTLSPVLGRHCRFEPTCSVYFIESVRKYGAVRGASRGVMRICRCHPWHPGGIDPP